MNQGEKKRIIWKNTELLNIKEKMGKLDCIKIGIFYSSKDTIKREIACTEPEKLFAIHITWQRIQSKIYKDPWKINKEKTDNH